MGLRQNSSGSLARISLTPRFSGVAAAPDTMKPFQRFPALPSAVLPPTPLSHSSLGEVAKYMAGQEEHHRRRSYADELRLSVQRYGLIRRADETVETVSMEKPAPTPC